MSDDRLPLDGAAELVGGYRWIEGRLFELVGAWSAVAPFPEVRVFLSALSSQFGWHAELWEERLPVLDTVDRDALTRAPGPAADTLLAALAGGPVATRWEWRLAGLFRVVIPRLLVTYTAHLDRAVPVSDGPTIRTLRLVSRDHGEAWLAGEALVERILAGGGGAQSAASAQGELEAVVTGAGVVAGLVPWPGEDSSGRGT